ncbi:hypothetical protein F4678DRAFT_282343 [Xylaria arbuscula]|nr:hypothetical protein F4678DRAFT_282343 [Xylaria arbuscula]
MGNTPSVEASGKSSRTTQRLSKPRTGNPAAAGLLNPSSVSDIIRRPPSTTGRCLSLPHSSTPVPSPRHFEPEDTAVDDMMPPHGGSAPREDFSPRSLFQSDSQGAQSVGTGVSVSRGRRMSRTNSSYTGADEGYEQAQLDLAANLTRSPSSVNYDLSSYEAQRLLSLVEAPALEDQSIVSESQFQEALSRRQSYTHSYHPAYPDANVPLPRTSSDVSLYTPMRRRSLMTPGVATRPVPKDRTVSSNLQAGPVSPATPSFSFSGSFDPVGVGFLSVPPSSFDPSLIPRAHTPCEADYQQTGGFKHGTLRITNGSPVRTPARETTDDGLSDSSQSIAKGQGTYFTPESQVRENRSEDAGNSQPTFPAEAPSSTSGTSANNLATMTNEHQAALNFLPELKLTLSPISIDGIQPGVWELQTTSKHTATEDLLFEGTSPDFGTEVLNVRLDRDAKHDFFPPSELLDEGKGKDIERSDSAIVASPVSEAPHKTLSKADSGYSSSVSVRSSSSRRKGQRETNHSPKAKSVSTKASASKHAKVPSRSGPIGHQEKLPQSPSSDGLPPQVPDKDDHIKVSEQLHDPINDSRATDRKSDLLSSMALASRASGPSRHSDLEPNTSTPISSLSIGNARQPGKLQRFLSGTRTPLTVHVTHTLDIDAGVPPVPRDIQAKLHERSALSPNSAGNSGSAGASKESSKPTVASTSRKHEHNSEIPATQNHSSRARTDQDKMRSFKPSFNIQSISSTITRAASSVMAKNPILRKTALSGTKADDVDATFSVEDSQWPLNDVENMDSNSSQSTRERGPSGKPEVAKGRANSLSACIGPDSRVSHDPRRSSLTSRSEQHASAFRKPSAQGQYSVSKTPPPISMKTRAAGQLRVPPLLRPRSTPPARSVAPTLSHKSSRDGVQSYPPYKYPMNSNDPALSRRPSQENFYMYSPAQIQGYLNHPSQIPSTIPFNFQADPGELRGPRGITNSNHGITSSRESSFDHSRHNSLASQASYRSAFSNGQPWPHHLPYDAPALKHRSSYDGYSLQGRQNYGQRNGPYAPLPQMNGQAYVSGHQSSQHMVHQSMQYQQHARYGSRHLRHHSLDQNGYPTPYRVLHSYNSPAYRGVPIWSA